MTTLDELRLRFDILRAEAKIKKTPEARKAARDAWAELEAETIRVKGPMKKSGVGSRAGRRQAAERQWARPQPKITTIDNSNDPRWTPRRK